MPLAASINSLGCYQTLVVEEKTYAYYNLSQAEHVLGPLSHMPCCMRILLENIIRHENEKNATIDDMRAVVAFQTIQKNTPVINFSPARLLLDDVAGVSVATDIAAMRDLLAARKTEPLLVQVACPTTIVTETSLDNMGTSGGTERMEILKWLQKTTPAIRVIPPSKGRVNQINIDLLGQPVSVVPQHSGEAPLLVPNTALSTDPLAALGGSCGSLAWCIDTLEAESLMLGEMTALSLPFVLGIKITGKIHKGTQATDIALELGTLLQQTGCAGRFVEFFGAGLDHLTVKDRALLSRFAIEAGALATTFPIDAQTIEHLRKTGVDAHHVAVTETYAKTQGLWRETGNHNTRQDLSFSDLVEFALDDVRPSVRPTLAIQSIALTEAKTFFEKRFQKSTETADPLAVIRHGDVFWADIGSHDGSVHATELVTAALIARKALSHGLRVKPWVKAFISSISPVAETALTTNGLVDSLKEIGFLFSGRLPPAPATRAIQPRIEEAILAKNVTVCALYSAPPHRESYPASLAKAGYIMAPSLIMAYAIAGTFLVDLATQPLGVNKDGKPVMLKELVPTVSEINAVWDSATLPSLFDSYRADLYHGDSAWNLIPMAQDALYEWKETSTFVRKPPFLKDPSLAPAKLKNVFECRILAIYGDNVPASAMAAEGEIPDESMAGEHLVTLGETAKPYGSFHLRTGNAEIMARGSFAGKALVNALLPAASRTETGKTIHTPTQSVVPFFEATHRYWIENTVALLVGGKNFGFGLGQEWAVKALKLQSVYAVLAESFDPAFRLNLVRLGVLPLQLKSGVSLADLNFDGSEFINLAGLPDIDRPPGQVMMTIEHPESVERYMVVCRLDTPEEFMTYRCGSFWATGLRNLISLADQAKT